MAIPDKDKGQSISIDDIEDEFLNEDDGLGQDTPISFGSFRGELGTFFGIPLSFSQFSGKSIDPDLQPITATGGRITSDFNGLRQYTLGESGTLTAYKVSQSYGEVSKGLTVTWKQTVGKLSANLNIDNETGESITFSAPFALNNTAVTVRATVVDWQGDESTEDFTFIIRGYQVPDPPALEDNTVDGAPNGTRGILSQYSLEGDFPLYHYKSASAEFELTEDSAYHPLGLEYEITWQIVNSYGGTFNVETRERSDGRKYLYVERTSGPPADDEQGWVDIRGEASDPYNPATGEVIRITFERAKKRLNPITYSSSNVKRTSISQLPSDIKGDMSQIKTDTAALPDDYNVILFVQVKARYFTTSEDSTGQLSLADNSLLPLVGESISSGKINYNTHWGASDGWNVAYRSDARCKLFELGATDTSNKSVSVAVNVNNSKFKAVFYNYTFYNTNYSNYDSARKNVFYSDVTVKEISNAVVEVNDAIGRTLVFGAFKVMKASEVASMPDNLNIFRNYKCVNEEVRITAVHTKDSEVKSHHLFLCKGGNFSEKDTHPSKVQVSTGNVIQNDSFDNISDVYKGSEGYGDIFSYSDLTKPRYPNPYYLSNIAESFSGLDSYSNVPSDSTKGIFPIPDATMVIGSVSINTALNGNEVRMLPVSRGLMLNPGTTSADIGWTDISTASVGTSGSWPFRSANYGWVRAKEWKGNVAVTSAFPSGNDLVRQTTIPLKGGSSSEFDESGYGTKPNVIPHTYGTVGSETKNTTTNLTTSQRTKKATFYRTTSNGRTKSYYEGLAPSTITRSTSVELPNIDPIMNMGYGWIQFYVYDELYEGETDTIDNVVYLEGDTPPNEFNVNYDWD